MRKNKPPLTKEDLIQKIEARLQQPDVPLREFTSLTKRLANLKGWVKQGEYHRVRADQQQEPPQEPEPLPTWWSETWVRVFLVESLCGRRPDRRFAGELTRYWAGLSDEEKQEVEAEVKYVSELPHTAEEWREW